MLHRAFISATLLTALVSALLWAPVLHADEPADPASRWRIDVDANQTLPVPALESEAPFYRQLGPLNPFDAQRPRVSVSLTPGAGATGTGLYGAPQPDSSGTFSWSLEAWQLNTASLAHIQCSRASRTLETYLAEDCRFVDQPPPSNAASLIQVRGQWLAAPGVRLGVSAFSGESRPDAPTTMSLMEGGLVPGPATLADDIDGLDVNLSFGVHAGRIGDLLLDLQLSRYRRQPQSLSMLADPLAAAADSRFQTAGQLALGWRKGDFRGGIMGHYRELPYWFGPGQGESFNSFDIEFSWRAPRNASLSVGVTNVLDNLPAGENTADGGFEESVESIYGRIPYVRYKHDL